MTKESGKVLSRLRLLNRQPRAAHAAMLLQLRRLEVALTQLQLSAVGIGDQPGERIEALDANDIRQLRAALALLRVQPVYPTESGNAARAAATTIDRKSEKLAEWVAGLGDSFAAEATKEIEKEFGKWGTRVTWLLIADVLVDLSKAIQAWLRLM